MNAIGSYISNINKRIFEWGFILLGSALIASGVVFYLWLELGMIIIGLWCVALTFAMPLYALLFWLFASPILDFYLRIPLGGGIPDMTFARGMIIVLLFVILLQGVFKLREILPVQGIEKAMMIFSGLCLAGMLLNEHTSETAQNLQIFADGYASPFLLFFISKNIIGNKQDSEKLMTTALAAGLYLALIGIIQYFTEVNLFVPEGFSGIHDKRAYGPFVNAAEYGGVMVLFFLGAFYLYSRGNKKKTVVLGIIGIMGLAVFLSMTRAVWLSLALSMLIVAWNFREYRKIYLWSIFLGLAAVAIIWFMLPDSSFFKERTSDLGAIYSRFALYMTAFNTIISNPIMGYGFDRYSFFEASRDHLASFQFIDEAYGLGLTVPHNEFVHITVMTGIFGIISYISIFYLMYKYSNKFYFSFEKIDEFERNLTIIFWASLSVFILNGIFVDLLFFTYFNSVFYIIAGMMEGVRMRYVNNGLGNWR